MLLAAVVVSVADMWRLMLGGSKPVCAAVGIGKSCCTFLNSWSTQQYPARHICLHHTGTEDCLAAQCRCHASFLLQLRLLCQQNLPVPWHGCRMGCTSG